LFRLGIQPSAFRPIRAEDDHKKLTLHPGTNLCWLNADG
jgi:hypothetical protein